MAGGAPTSERAQRAYIANMRQDLLSPVAALAGYADLLRDQSTTPPLAGFQDDVERIGAAVSDLTVLIDRVLPVDGEAELPPADKVGDFESRLRHDLRNPLNAVKGYTELLLEEIGEENGAMQPDLEKLLIETDAMLGQLDRIVDFSGLSSEATTDAGGEAASESIAAKLVRSIKAVDVDFERDHETGRILVVDDNASNRDLLDRRLSLEGHQVTTAESGEEALAILRSTTFDAVLLDLMMPGLNGFEVLERMKADQHLHDIPVIMISGFQETDSVIRCIEAGAEDYLSKPFNPVVLRARLKACLERKKWLDRERLYLERIEHEKAKHEALLHHILPGEIVTRLNDGEAVIADRFDDVTILFADLVGFTEMATRISAAELVALLNRVFSRFDRLCHELAVEKIKTIGDGYMVAAGLPEPRDDHAVAVATLATRMLACLKEVNIEQKTSLRLRVGMHTGSVIAGVIGEHRFLYDVWGESVNLASRMESHGQPDRVHLTEETRQKLGTSFVVDRRGGIEIKGLGKLETFFLMDEQPRRPQQD